MNAKTEVTQITEFLPETELPELSSLFISVVKKGLLGLVIGGAFLALALVSPLTLVFSRFSRRNIQPMILKAFSKLAMLVLNVKIIQVGEKIKKVPRGSIIVGNHISYLDIPVLASLHPSLFISTVEVKGMFFFGTLMKLAGSIVIERRNKANLANELNEVEDAQKDGMNIMFFPEAKATEGVELLQFKRPFFKPSEKFNLPVLVQHIHYEKVNGEELFLHNKDQVVWYRNSPMLEHIFQLAELKSIQVKITSTMVDPRALETLGDGTVLANYCREVVAKTWKPYVAKN